MILKIIVVFTELKAGGLSKNKIVSKTTSIGFI